MLDARVLHGDIAPPYTGMDVTNNQHRGFGFGPERETLAGLPHFRQTEFIGKYPFAQVLFKEKGFPGSVNLTAFNPLIPGNDIDSGIPGAFLMFDITNTTTETIDYTIAGSLANPLPAEQVHRICQQTGVSLMHLSSTGVKSGEPSFGDLSIATDSQRVSYQQYWFKGGWFDSLEVYWHDLMTRGKFANRSLGISSDNCDCADSPKAGTNNTALLAAHVKIKPGQTRQIKFAITWNFPVCENYWDSNAAKKAESAGISPCWKNYYATIWNDSTKSAFYAFENWGRLLKDTKTFHDALFGTTIPDCALDAVSANISILKTPTVLRLQDGTFYGFEGCMGASGCCEGNCTHVWHYAQALPFLFPALERSVRNADYTYNQQPNGGMPFRIPLPLGIKNGGGRSCADGLFGNVLMVYRDWKISGNTEWLRTIWPSVKKSIEFAWDPTNPDLWDPQKTGVLWGRQHHTLDMELFGPSSWLCGFYIGALKAAGEMATFLGDTQTAEEYSALFINGKTWVDENLFNGEYYSQKIDIRDKSIVDTFKCDQTYWNGEHKEIKYQIDEGCSIDQVLAQFHANLYGLGEIFDPQKTRASLKSLFRYNFFPSMRNMYNPCRLYALNDESGLVICAWPEQKRKPAIPITYAQEAMHGFEYAAAIQMIQNNMIKEGVAVVKGVRDRYDGEKRNPWNEIECGSNYARSMASYALLNAFSGFEFDMSRNHIGFKPVVFESGNFCTFWSLEGSWGIFEIAKNSALLKVLWGELPLKSISFGTMNGYSYSATLSGRKIPSRIEDGKIIFSSLVTVGKAAVLKIQKIQKMQKKKA